MPVSFEQKLQSFETQRSTY